MITNELPKAKTRNRVVQVGGQEPHCPSCGNNNAMLHCGMHAEHVIKCRDCGFEVANALEVHCDTFSEAKLICQKYRLAWNN